MENVLCGSSSVPRKTAVCVNGGVRLQGSEFARRVVAVGARFLPFAEIAHAAHAFKIREEVQSRVLHPLLPTPFRLE